MCIVAKRPVAGPSRQRASVVLADTRTPATLSRDPSLTALLVLEVCLVFLAARGVAIARPVGETLVLAVLVIVIILSPRRGAIMAILLGLAVNLASLHSRRSGHR